MGLFLLFNIYSLVVFYIHDLIWDQLFHLKVQGYKTILRILTDFLNGAFNLIFDILETYLKAL